MKDQANDLKVVDALVPAVRGSADVNGATVSRVSGGVVYESVTYAIQFGAEGDTIDGTTYFQLEMEHSDDDGAGSPASWTNCGASDVLVPEDMTVVLDGTDSIVALINAVGELPVTVKVGYVGGKYHSRLVLNKEGTHTNGTPVAAVAILGNPSVLPVAA